MATAQPATGQTPSLVAFYDDYRPSLPAGGYAIHFEAAVDGVGASLPTGRQGFVVDGPQFTLPPGEIHSVYPPANSVGQFGAVLPMAVLATRALPWERQIATTGGAPWLALLVLQDNEVAVDPATNSPLVSMSVAEFLAPETDVAVPHIDLTDLAPEVLASQMSAIEIEADLFRAVAPRLNDLPFLAHVRANDVANQAVREGDRDPGWFAIVMANRFPANGSGPLGEGGRNHALLVSLEGWDAWLGSVEPGDAALVRLVVLNYWTFGSVAAPGASFADLAENLASPETDGAGALLLRAPALAA